MELWIRSQDKECLMKIERVDYDYSNGQHQIKVGGFATLVGTYETKERALEVLDEIQYLLSMPPVHIDNGVEYYMPNDGSSKIYEMPKE